MFPVPVPGSHFDVDIDGVSQPETTVGWGQSVGVDGPNIALFPTPPGSEVTQSVEVTWDEAAQSPDLTPQEAAQFRVDIYAQDTFAQLTSVDVCGNRTLLSNTPDPLNIDVEQEL
jgi:hypothetical protein